MKSVPGWFFASGEGGCVFTEVLVGEEKAEVKVEAERGSDCPHLSLSLDLSLLRAYL